MKNHINQLCLHLTVSLEACVLPADCISGCLSRNRSLLSFDAPLSTTLCVSAVCDSPSV